MAIKIQSAYRGARSRSAIAKKHSETKIQEALRVLVSELTTDGGRVNSPCAKPNLQQESNLKRTIAATCPTTSLSGEGARSKTEENSSLDALLDATSSSRKPVQRLDEQLSTVAAARSNKTARELIEDFTRQHCHEGDEVGIYTFRKYLATRKPNICRWKKWKHS